MGITHPLDYDLILFDLDGTLRWCREHHGPCHNGAEQWEIIPGTQAILAQYNWATTDCGFVTNQGGIALGYTTAWDVEHEIDLTMLALWDADIVYDKEALIGGDIFRFSPYAPDASSYMRKPSPYMILDLVGAYEARLDRTLYVGDSPEDEEAARRAGVSWLWAWQFFHRPEQPPNVTKSYQVVQQEHATHGTA